MKIAIAAAENSLKSTIDPHFGRCKWFCLYDTETKNADFIQNNFQHGNEKAGIDAVMLLLSHGIGIAIAGRFGSRVVESFRKNRIQMIVPEKLGSVSEFIKMF